jgi:hypothetical protein
MGKVPARPPHVESQKFNCFTSERFCGFRRCHKYGVGYRTDGNAMSRQDNYRKSAAETVDLAHRVTTPADKAHLVALAQRWLDLADGVAKRAKRQARDAQEWAAKHKSAA